MSARSEGNHERTSDLYDCLETDTLADVSPLFDIADAPLSAGQPAFQITY